MVTGFYTGILALMLSVLILRIVFKRRKYQVGIGDGGIPDLAQAIRVHGNFTETAPILIMMLLLMEESSVHTWILHVFGGGVVISRFLHAYGITSSPLKSFGRLFGMAITTSLFILGGFMLIFKYL